MAVLRNPNKEKFTVVDNVALRDGNLSLKARGLLVTMLSMPDNWKFSENGLCSIFRKDGQASVRSGLKELEENGYLVRKRERDSFGRVTNVSWTIYDYPQLENPSMDNPNLDNLPQLNTKQLNTKERNTEREKRKRFSPPSVDEVREYCQQRGNAIDPEAFVAFYASKGWKVGSQSMKSWKDAVITWEKRSAQNAPKEQKKKRFVGTEIVDGEEVAIYE